MSSVVDRSLQGNYDKKEAWRLAHLGLLCAHSETSRRPEMFEVVKMLEEEIATASPGMSLNNDQYLLDYPSVIYQYSKSFL